MTSANKPERAVRRHLGPADRIGIPNKSGETIFYRCVASNEDGHVLQREDLPDIHFPMTHEEFARVERTSGYQLQVDRFAVKDIEARLMSGQQDFSSLPLKEQKKIAWKMEWVTRYEAKCMSDGATLSDESIKETRAIIQAEMIAEAQSAVAGGPRDATIAIRKVPGIKKLREWVGLIREYRSPLVLLGRTDKSGNRTPRIEPEVENEMRVFALKWCGANRRSRRGIYKDFCAHLKTLNAKRAGNTLPPYEIPSCKTLSDRVDQIAKSIATAGRHGTDAAEKEYRPVTWGLDVVRPGTWVEMDEWRIPLLTLANATGVWSLISDDLRNELAAKRAWLSAGLDVASRCFLAMRLGATADTKLGLKTMRMMVSDKGRFADAVGALTPWDMHCGVSVLSTDQASWYVSDETHRAALGMGAFPVHPPAGMAAMRAHVERVFGTIHTGLIERFSGRNFANVVARGDYLAEQQKSLTVDELCWVLVRYVVDVYHNTPHDGLGGETPRNAWLRLTDRYGTTRLPGADTLRNVFGQRGEATLDKRGVRTCNLWFQSEALQQLFQQHGPRKVQIILDPENLGRISVSVDGKNWLTVLCLRPGFDGVGLRAWNDTQAELRRHFGEQSEISEHAVYRALAEIQAISDEAMRRAGISALLTDEEIAVFQKRLNISWRIDGAAPEEVDDPLSGIIAPPALLAPSVPTTASPVATPKRARSNRPAPNTPSQDEPPPRSGKSGTTWTLED